MELYLDSADLGEIEEGLKLGFLTGLTTTPTFMHRGGVKDIDGLILKLAKMVPILQIEALGKTAEEIVAEAHRQLKMGLDKRKTVFKIPVSLEGVKACKMLTDEGLMVNIHLVYTLQQAYMAMQAGATYVCPLVGRLQDQGHDALGLVEDCVEAVNYYGYNTKIMFSSVRNVEHIKNAIQIGVHSITVPLKILQKLTDNHFTQLGTDQFFEHTKLMTVKVKDVMRTVNPLVSQDLTLGESLVKMTEFGFGAVTVVGENEEVLGVFTDGDLRRMLSENKDILNKKMSEFEYQEPVKIEAEAILFEANELFQSSKVDSILVMEGDKAIGMIDIQDMN